MSKKSDDGLIVLLVVVGGIIYFIVEYWYIAIIILAITIYIYNYERKKKKKKEDEYNKAISISQIDTMDGIEFEFYIDKLLKNEGFYSNVTKGSNDFGVDIIASKNKERYAVQVKRYTNNVSRIAVSDAVVLKTKIINFKRI